MDVTYDELKNVVGILWGPDTEEIKESIYILETMAAGFQESGERDLAGKLAGIARQIKELSNRQFRA